MGDFTIGSAGDSILAQIDKFLQTGFAQLGALAKGGENFHFLKNFISDKIMHNMLTVISAKHKHLFILIYPSKRIFEDTR